MELFVTVFDSFHSLAIVIKISILDVTGTLDSVLIADIFASQSWIFGGVYRRINVPAITRSTEWVG